MKFLEIDAVWIQNKQHVSDKGAVLSFFAHHMAPHARQTSEQLFEAFLAREALQSTAFEKGVALPHCILDKVDDILIGFLRVDVPIIFNEKEDITCDLFFCIIAGKNSGAEYLKTLAKVSRFIRDNTNKENLRQAKSRDDIITLLHPFDQS